MTNIEKREVYKSKQKILGNNSIYFMQIGEDIVLKQVSKTAKKVVIPDFITKIDEMAFDECIFEHLIIKGVLREFKWLFTNYRGEKLKIDIEHPDSIVNLSGAFALCPVLVEIDLSSISFNNVISTYAMFKGCISLKRVRMPDFTGSKLVEVGEMFEECSALEAIDISTLDTSRVKHFEKMFAWCYSLSKIDISKLNFSSAVAANEMFKMCPKIPDEAISNIGLCKLRG